MEEKELYWVVGLLEGEGTFYTQTNGSSPRVACEMTDLDVLERLESICGGYIWKPKKRQDHWKQSWSWRMSGDSAAELMTLIKPHMGARRQEKIQDVLQIWYSKGRPYSEEARLRDIAAKEYLDGNGSLREIGKKYGFSYESVRRRAAALKTP